MTMIPIKIIQQKQKDNAQSLSIFKGYGRKSLNKQSIFKSYQKSFVNQLKRGHSFLSEEQIKTSKLYQKLLKRIQNAIFLESMSVKNHLEMIQRINDQKQITKHQIKQSKMDMWQLKNQILDLEDLLKEQIQTYEQLAYIQNSEDQTSVQDKSQLSNCQSQDQDGDGEDNDREDDQEEDEQLYYNQQEMQQEQQISKPSCSIKKFISGEYQCSNNNISSNRMLQQDSQQNDLTILYKKNSYKDALQKQNHYWPSQAFGKKIYSQILNTTKQI